MNIDVMHEMSVRSFAGTAMFPEVVMKLLQIGVESYHADLVCNKKTFYMPNGQTHCEKFDFQGPAISENFSTEMVVTAIRAIQKSEISYPEFLNQIMRAGTTHYNVFLQGKKAIYFGRKGDFHIENFPPMPESGTANI